MTNVRTWSRQRERDPHARARGDTLAHVLEGLPPTRERVLRAHLATCESCRDHYDEVLGIASLDPRARSFEERLARGLGFRPEAPPRWRWAAVPTLAGLAAVGLWLLLARVPKTDPDAGFLPRGPSPAAAVEGMRALPEVVTFAVEAGQKPRAVEGVIGVHDELAFAYRNPTSKRRLMVFAIDEHDHVYWYHPGWLDPATNPKAVPISTDPGLHELPAAVSQTYDGEHLMLHALFTDRELTVRQVEEALARRREDARPGREPGAVPEAFRDGVDVSRGLRVKQRP